MRIYLFLILIVLASCKNNETLKKESYDLSKYVNPLIGTDGHGHTYPGASMPFGMMQLSPDTRIDGWDGCSAYHFSDSIVYGFSHTHLSGTGCSDYGDILIMPYKSNISTDFSLSNKYPTVDYFSHRNEIAEPGFYSVKLNSNINVDLTVTERCGFHKYIFNRTGGDISQSSIYINLEHRDEVIDSHIEIINDTTIAGYRFSKAWATNQKIFFYIILKDKISDYDIYCDENISKEKYFKGKDIKASFNFNKDTVLLKIGISAVSIDGAKNNLENEIPHWNFDDTKINARNSWNNELNKIQVFSSDTNKLITFYTSLYHSFLSPNIYNDVDGKYRGRDDKIHTANGFNYYTVFSLWDTYRATHPLFTIVQQKRTIDFIKTFLEHYKQVGILPVWELSSNETDCMIGYHSVSVISDAIAKGITDFDINLAYEAMKASSMNDKYGLEFYKKYGFISAEQEHESVSKTLEYAYDDWCIAQVAKFLNKKNDYNYYLSRSQSYKHLFDPETKLMRARINGSWWTPFDPSEVNFNYTEANSWQYSFYVPHDVYGLVNLMGGEKEFENKLDEMFNAKSQTSGRHQVDITGLIGQYAHGNEPSHHMAYLYSYINKGSKTQYYINRIINELYTSNPDGLCGNEDCGQMSSWYVMSSLGFYPVCPGSDKYIIGSPSFEKAIINLENNNSFEIKANNLNKNSFYVNKVESNSKGLTNNYIAHGEIINGGNLVFDMTADSLSTFNTKSKIPETDFSEKVIISAPFVLNGQRTFIDSFLVKLRVSEKDCNIYYTLDGSEPNEKSFLFKTDFYINQNASIRAIAVKNKNKSPIISSEIKKVVQDKKIKILSTYNPQYTAGGDYGLIDYIRGGNNFRLGYWQGYQSQDFEAIIELNEIKNVNKVTIGLLQDIRSWIWMPKSIDIYFSLDGKKYSKAGNIITDIADNDYTPIQKDFLLEPKNIKTKFIKVIAKNYGKIPDWHLGKGGDAFIFIDEILVE